MKSKPLKIAGIEIQPGERLTLALPTPEIYTCAPLHIPIHVLHGKKEGPVILICATFYGDEVNGIEIVQRLLQSSSLKSLQGSIIAIPVVNIYGLMNRSRFLPDGHDLAHSFPGSEKGSFAARFAKYFSTEILDHCSHCICIRTGGPHTYKIPQVYFRDTDTASADLAKTFGVALQQPLVEEKGFFLHDSIETNRPTLIYEGGEAHRVDEWIVKSGVKGIMKVLRHLKMIPTKGVPKSTPPRVETIENSYWIRASGSGLFHFQTRVGHHVYAGERLGVITDPFGTEQKYVVTAPEEGVIRAVNTHPLVYEGQGVVQIGISRPSDEPIEIPPIQPDLSHD